MRNASSRVGNQEVVKGPLDKLDKVKKAGMQFYREANLDPGRYTIAAVVYDNTTRRSGTNTATVVVPPRSNTLRLSSIVVIKRPAARRRPKLLKPFQFDDMLLIPNLGEPVSKANGNQLTVFVTVYTAKGDKTAPKLSLRWCALGGLWVISITTCMRLMKAVASNTPALFRSINFSPVIMSSGSLCAPVTA